MTPPDAFGFQYHIAALPPDDPWQATVAQHAAVLAGLLCWPGFAGLCGAVDAGTGCIRPLRKRLRHAGRVSGAGSGRAKVERLTPGPRAAATARLKHSARAGLGGGHGGAAPGDGHGDTSPAVCALMARTPRLHPHGSRQLLMPDAPIAALRHLHQQRHCDDPPPQTARAQQAAFVLTRMRQTVLALVSQGVTPTTLELTCLYHWLRLTALLRGLSEAQCEAWTADKGAVMRPLVALLTELEPTLREAGPTPAMAALGAHVQQRKDVLQALAQPPLTPDEIVRHTDLANRAAFGLVQTCLEVEVPPGLVANVFLYDWLRASTINANVPEPFFQTLERCWDVVVERVAAFMERLVQRAALEAGAALGHTGRGPHLPPARSPAGGQESGGGHSP